ncbi:MAG: hypothetical protein C0504_08055 [Candidatus Solibacter sp.]|nr:hypothetical protein [Candidatus Solibacter sp.]
MRHALVLLLISSLPITAQSPSVSGVILDSSTAEPLSGVQLELVCSSATARAVSSPTGAFSLPAPASPPCSLSARLVGYHPAASTVLPAAPALRLALTPSQMTRRDSLDVSSGPFDLSQQSSPSERTLSANEVKNLAGLIGDDPLRAIQALPGVASNNDFVSQFTLRGSGFDRAGILLDGILLHSPYHAVQTQVSQGSLTMFNSDVVEEVTLHAGAPPVRFGDRATGFVDIGLREGSRKAPSLRLQAGVAATSIVADGPLAGGRGSWLAAARKSYLQYLIRRAGADTSLAFGFLDFQGRLAYDLSPRHSLTLTLLDGHSDLDRQFTRNTLSLNSIMLGGYHTSVAALGWRYTPSASATVQSRFAWLREAFSNTNRENLDMARGQYGEWISNTDLSWTWSRHTPLSAGFQFRRLRDGGRLARYALNPLTLRRQETWRATAVRPGAFIEQGFATPGGLLSLSAGARIDSHELVSGSPISPHASLILRATSSTRLQLAFSQAVQFPELTALSLSLTGNAALRPARSTHAVAAIEQRLDSRTRLRLELYERRDRQLTWQPRLDPRLSPTGSIIAAAADPRFENSLRGRARGFEIFLQRRSANRITGWISYAYGWTRMNDSILATSFPSDWDQRHGVNTYLSFRLTPSVNLSTRYTYGSNFPVPGFLRAGANGTYFLDSRRNQVRMSAYHRADVRINKSFQWGKWRGTFFAEVMNLSNHGNFIYDSFGGFNSQTRQAFPRFDKLFPIIPAAGVMFEFDALAWRR